jgi:NitT/TauT family transport system ATP-binding protein
VTNAISPLVNVNDVSMIYRTRAPNGEALETVALKNANLEIGQGEFISLIGPSGCGKTTLLRLLADLIQPTSGSIAIGGKTPQQARESRAYGYVFQAPALFDWRTVMGNVMLPLEIMGYNLADRKARRVSIARALAFEPQLLFMDEPFGALDEITRENLNLELLRLWRETGKTIIFVTHSIPEAVFLSTRVVVMTPRPGKIEKIINVDLPHPRDFDTRESPRFFEIATEIRESLRHGHGYEGDE